VEIVAMSEEIDKDVCAARKGDKAIIHRGLQGTPITHDGEEYMMIGYVNLIAVL